MYFRTSLSTLAALASISIALIRAVPSTKVSIFLTADRIPECREEGALLPNPEDCGSFFHCSHGVAYLRKCPSILHFNPVLKVCDWPEDAGCESSSSIKDSDAFTCPEPDGLFPDPEDCNNYYDCISNEPFSKTCPGDLKFDREVGVCVPAQFADCSLKLELK